MVCACSDSPWLRRSSRMTRLGLPLASQSRLSADAQLWKLPPEPSSPWITTSAGSLVLKREPTSEKRRETAAAGASWAAGGARRRVDAAQSSACMPGRNSARIVRTERGGRRQG
eukprot:scaffold86223_cov33-Tisochrysis_lutea.AAC.1